MRKTRGARCNAVSQPLAGSLASLRFTSNLATSIATMSSDSYTGPPSQKRFRSENGLPIDSRLSEAPNGYEEASSETLRADFGPSQFGHLDGLGEKEDCVAEGGRHFCPPHYATSAAVAFQNDSELMSNGDSGFQDLKLSDGLNLNVIEEKLTNLEQGSGSFNLEGNNTQSTENGSDLAPNEDGVSGEQSDSDISSIDSDDFDLDDCREWIQMQMVKGMDPKQILHSLFGQLGQDTESLNDVSAWQALFEIFTQGNPRRTKLGGVNTIDDVVNLIQNSSKIIVLTGAGVSVSCGIPDFRSRDGIYARLKNDYKDLPDPQSMFDIRYFRQNPHPFFKFAKEIFPGQYTPSPSHRFIKCLEQKGKLLRNYTQNIDSLEKVAGIDNVITCHGSFATATCIQCGFKVDSSAIKDDIFAQRIPMCPKCEALDQPFDTQPVMKPDIVFFGEGLSDEFHQSMMSDKDSCDLLIVIGSSLKVRPVALIPTAIPKNIPQILINREPLHHMKFDVELLGDCDDILQHLTTKLGQDWFNFCYSHSLQPKNEHALSDYRFVQPSRYIFPGAEVYEFPEENNYHISPDMHLWSLCDDENSNGDLVANANGLSSDSDAETGEEVFSDASITKQDLMDNNPNPLEESGDHQTTGKYADCAANLSAQLDTTDSNSEESQLLHLD